MIAVYFNTTLKNKIGRSRKEWTQNDFNLAFEYLTDLVKFVEGTIKEYYNELDR